MCCKTFYLKCIRTNHFVTMQDMYGLRHRTLVGKRACATIGGSSEGTNADGGNSQRVDNDSVNSQMSNGAGDDLSNDGAIGTDQGRDDLPKKARGRGKRNCTQLRLPSLDGKVMLKPVGNR